MTIAANSGPNTSPLPNPWAPPAAAPAGLGMGLGGAPRVARGEPATTAGGLFGMTEVEGGAGANPMAAMGMGAMGPTVRSPVRWSLDHTL
jgi:hypothetical protein